MVQKDRAPSREYDSPNFLRDRHFLSLLSAFNDGLKKKYLKVPSYCFLDKVVGFCVQRLLNARKELFSKSPFTDCSKTMSPYMLFGNSTFHFQVLATPSENLSLLSQHKTLVDVGSPIRDEEWVDITAFDRLVKTDDAFRFVTSLMLGHLS